MSITKANGFNLLLQDFCNYCGDFEPEVEKYRCGAEWGEIPRCINNIRCKDRQKCSRIAEYIEGKINGQSEA